MSGTRLPPAKDHPRYPEWIRAYRNAIAARETLAALKSQLPPNDPTTAEVAAKATVLENEFKSLWDEIDQH